MPQEPAYIFGHHLFLEIEVNQAVLFMTKSTMIEITVEREKRWAIPLVQQGNYSIVFHSLPANILANLTKGYVSAAQ